MTRPEISREEIDEELFLPLADFLCDDEPDTSELKERMERAGLPASTRWMLSQYYGFTLEAYVKWALVRFNHLFRNRFHPANLHHRHFENGESYRANQWGNVVFYDRNGRTRAELDGLYEFSSRGIRIPVIVEVKSGGNAKTSHSDRKKGFVNRLYNSGTRSYLCKIRQENGVDLVGLAKIKKNSYYRRIVIPKRDDLITLSVELYQEFEGARVPNKPSLSNVVAHRALN
jgi:hypothetical protein